MPILSVTNAKGRLVNLLNDDPANKSTAENKKRRYQCTESGCQKSFTTSGHLARHHRIHTGEKNFHCIYPGCPSRFSRQDNMMQHYRTHLSSRSRHHQYLHHQHQHQRQQPGILHCHSYIRSEQKSELHPLKHQPYMNNSNRRNWSISSGSSSSTSSITTDPHSSYPLTKTTPTNGYTPIPPPTATTTPNQYTEKTYSLPPQLTAHNWNRPEYKYSTASYHHYNEFI